MSTKTKVSYETWFPHIEKLACGFSELSDKAHVRYNNIVVDDIKRAYPERLNALKQGIFIGMDISKGRIDRHKIIALYIQLCLEHRMFKLPANIDTKTGVGIETKLINEIFCLRFTKNILKAWNKKKRFLESKFKREYMSSFLKMLWHYKEKAEFQKHKEFFTYSLAHVIYFVERDFFK